jgi:hypothetical protein
MRKIQSLLTSIILLSVSLGFSIACSSKPASDDAIAKDIQTKVDADPATKDSQVVVAAKDHKVTLTGKVRTPDAQQKIEQIAREEPGAAAVENQTTVQPDLMPAPSQPTQAATTPPPPVEKPKPQPLVVPAGTVLMVKLGETLGSKTSQTGQSFAATLAQPVSVGGMTALPSGSDVSGKVVAAKAKGKFKGEGELDLALSSISVGGHTYPIQTNVRENTVKGKGKRTAVTTGGGAGGGALIGGIAGGGKGAGIGALVGAGAGLVGGALTGNKQIEIPAESAISFKLSAPLTIEPPPE